MAILPTNNPTPNTNRTAAESVAWKPVSAAEITIDLLTDGAGDLGHRFRGEMVRFRHYKGAGQAAKAAAVYNRAVATLDAMVLMVDLAEAFDRGAVAKRENFSRLANYWRIKFDRVNRQMIL